MSSNTPDEINDDPIDGEDSTGKLPAGGLYFRAVRGLCALFCQIYFRIEFLGVENVPPSGPFIVSPNHQSYFDPFWVSIPFRYPLRYMTWDRFVYMPVVGHFIRTLGAFPVKLDRGDRAALRLALGHLKSGGTLVLFPEGGRTRDGELMAFKPGVIRLALETGVPIVPVSIIGAYRAYNPHHLFPRPRKVKVLFHPPITVPQLTEGEDVKLHLAENAEKLKEIIRSGLPH